MKIILHLQPGSDGTLALRAANDLIENGHQNCVYTYTDGTVVYVQRNKLSITAFEQSSRQAVEAWVQPPSGYPQQETQTQIGFA